MKNENEKYVHIVFPKLLELGLYDWGKLVVSNCHGLGGPTYLT